VKRNGTPSNSQQILLNIIAQNHYFYQCYNSLSTNFSKNRQSAQSERLALCGMHSTKSLCCAGRVFDKILGLDLYTSIETEILFCNIKKVAR